MQSRRPWCVERRYKEEVKYETMCAMWLTEKQVEVADQSWLRPFSLSEGHRFDEAKFELRWTSLQVSESSTPPLAQDYCTYGRVFP